MMNQNNYNYKRKKLIDKLMIKLDMQYLGKGGRYTYHDIDENLYVYDTYHDILDWVRRVTDFDTNKKEKCLGVLNEIYVLEMFKHH